MKTFHFASWIRKTMAVLAVAMLAASPAWAAKYASIVVDMDTSQVLHARDADETRHPASLTKVMTLYLVFDALDSGKLKLNERLPVSKAASRQQPSKLGLKAGATIKVEDAIRALVTKSANDVAVVFADKLAGSESKFAVKMNAKAKELGLEKTVFKNASGLPNNRQVTTARDMAKLAEAMFLDHKDRYNYFALPSFTWNKRKYENHNTLLKKVKGVDGIKTGYTNASGYNLMASAERDGRRIIAVMMGGTSGRSRDAHVADLLEAAFLDISGVAVAGNSDLRSRISFGEGGNASADDLALAQLRKVSEPEVTETPLIASALISEETALLASVDDDADALSEANSSTEEGDEAFETAQGDADSSELVSLEGAAVAVEVPVPAAAPAPSPVPAPVPVAIVPEAPPEPSVLITSEYNPAQP